MAGRIGTEVHQEDAVVFFFGQEVADPAVAVAAGTVVLLGIQVTVEERPCSHAFDGLAHVTVEHRYKLQQRLRRWGEFQTATGVRIWSAVKTEAPRDPLMYLK